MNSGRDKRVPGERNFWIITGIPQQDDLWEQNMLLPQTIPFMATSTLPDRASIQLCDVGPENVACAASIKQTLSASADTNKGLRSATKSGL
jgi:hypothetical protein